jgi:probable HAF family extracellular repeat protein
VESGHQGKGGLIRLGSVHSSGNRAVGVIASNVNNSNDIVGFYYTNTSPYALGFLDLGGAFYSLSDPNGTNTIAFGINNVGDVVGSFVDASGETQGFLYNWNSKTWQTISDSLASAAPIFCGSGIPLGCIDGTTVLGVNDAGQLVGFYSDGTHVNGFLATVPERDLGHDADRLHGAGVRGIPPLQAERARRPSGVSRG